MTETKNEKPENETYGRFLESNGRTRYSLKPLTHLLKDSDDSDGVDSEDIEDSSESEDDWLERNNKKRKRKSKIINITPVQTLKKKLAEKTKALRKNACKNKTHSPVEASTETAEPVKTSTETAEPAKTSDSQQEESQVETEVSRVKQFKVEFGNEVKIEKTVPKIKIENVVSTDNEVSKLSESNVDIKIKNSETLSSAEKTKKNEPVVLTYSMVKNSSNISPFLLVKDPASNPSTSSSPALASPAATSSTSLPVPVTSPNLTTSVPSIGSSPSPSLFPNASLTPPAPRIRIRSNLQASPAFRNSLTVPCRSPAPIIPAGPRPRLRAPTPRTPRTRTPRTPQTFHGSPVSPAVSNSIGRPRKPLSAPIPAAHSRPFGGSQSPVTPSRTSVNLQKTPNLKDSDSLKNISPKGTVIYHGSNSVTITPRKVVPEKPPVQRKLFKNEIEGIIAVRHENGVLKYVVNLANGTHMPLTEHQVAKLREQNGGCLPTKLKIPVPSDVAAKIEPSYLIED